MHHSLPDSAQVRAALAPLSLKQLEKLAELSGVPFTTIYKIKRGETDNPGIETVRKFLPHVSLVAAA
ncbi:MAG: helix-turn-helix domain-containing protein [Caldilineaceae bacterium]